VAERSDFGKQANARARAFALRASAFFYHHPTLWLSSIQNDSFAPLSPPPFSVDIRRRLVFGSSEWPDWANVRQLGHCLCTLGSLPKNYTISPYFRLHFSEVPTKILCINFWQKRVGLHFGRFCHQRIWSPCRLCIKWNGGLKRKSYQQPDEDAYTGSSVFVMYWSF
jgi:uncharacterized protein YqcC (DUF446 family)